MGKNGAHLHDKSGQHLDRGATRIQALMHGYRQCAAPLQHLNLPPLSATIEMREPVTTVAFYSGKIQIAAGGRQWTG